MERVSDARLSYPQLRRAARTPMSARPSACRAGCTASATMAACCSSICATITASPRSSPTRTARRCRCSRRCELESVVTIDGEVKARAAETVNPNLPTGEIEVFARAVDRAERAPRNCRMPVAGEQDYPEDIRLKYRFLDLRRETRARATSCCARKVIASLRRRMIEQGFTEFQTPILARFQPRRRARLPRAEPPASRASSMRCRRRRRCSSSC